jgi:hypothetical protein
MLVIPFTWLGSYAAVWGIIAVIQYAFGNFFFGGRGPVWSPHVVAVLCILGLIYETVRGVGKLFDPRDYIDSFEGIDAEKVTDAYRMGFVLSFAWVAQHILLAAPLATIKAIETRRLLTRMGEAQTRQAQELLDDLKARNIWLPVSQARADPLVIMALLKARLIWIREHEELVEIRIDPSWLE